MTGRILPATSADPTARFADRVDDYVRWRPGYPTALIDHLLDAVPLDARSVIADVGSGTGLSTAMFLDAGCSAIAVEPNAPMRAAAERLLGERAGFRSVDGRAEATTLGDGSVDLVAAGTAFHWFDPVPTRVEFTRILRGAGRVALFWNVRRRDDAFMRDYEQVLMRCCPGYAETDAGQRGDEASVRAFFGAGFDDRREFPNAQALEFEGLLGRVLSSSYAPKPTQTGYSALEAALRALFERSSIDGRVTLRYDTRLYLGRMT